MSLLESLPNRALTFEEVDELDEIAAGAAPYSGLPGYNAVFALMFVTENTLYGLGFDEDRSGWVVIQRAEIESPTEYGAEASEKIDTAINEWVEEKYGDTRGNEVFEV